MGDAPVLDKSFMSEIDSFLSTMPVDWGETEFEPNESPVPEDSVAIYDTNSEPKYTTHASPAMTGTVKWYSEEKGYGFITPDPTPSTSPITAPTGDCFAHRNELHPSLTGLKEGDRVTFVVREKSDGKAQACGIERISRGGGGSVSGKPERRKQGSQANDSGSGKAKTGKPNSSTAAPRSRRDTASTPSSGRRGGTNSERSNPTNSGEEAIFVQRTNGIQVRLEPELDPTFLAMMAKAKEKGFFEGVEEGSEAWQQCRLAVVRRWKRMNQEGESAEGEFGVSGDGGDRKRGRGGMGGRARGSGRGRGGAKRGGKAEP